MIPRCSDLLFLRMELLVLALGEQWYGLIMSATMSLDR